MTTSGVILSVCKYTSYCAHLSRRECSWLCARNSDAPQCLSLSGNMSAQTEAQRALKAGQAFHLTKFDPPSAVERSSGAAICWLTCIRQMSFYVQLLTRVILWACCCSPRNQQQARSGAESGAPCPLAPRGSTWTLIFSHLPEAFTQSNTSSHNCMFDRKSATQA